MSLVITVGVLALQGAFVEHIALLKQACEQESLLKDTDWKFTEVRTATQLNECDALIIPGGESTTVSLIAARSGLLEPLRDFVKKDRRPTWGTCAGLILLAESANRTKKGGQDLIGGLDVRVNRNHFGRQTESFEAELDLPFLGPENDRRHHQPFNGIFIRAPIVERLLPQVEGEQVGEAQRQGTVTAPSRQPRDPEITKNLGAVEVLAVLPGRSLKIRDDISLTDLYGGAGDIVAVRQGKAFGTSFHPELTSDSRIHAWWLQQVREDVRDRS